MLRHRLFREELRGERGSAMTEFVIGLPIFILLFVGILNMHSLAVGSVLVKGRAHAKMWRKAIDVQTALVPGWEINPITAAVNAGIWHNDTGGGAIDIALDSGSGLAAATGLSGGIMAESYSRVKPVDFVENVGDYNERVTWNINEVYLIENSNDPIANDLMNDALDFGAIGGGGGALGALNSVLDFAGVRPAMAAGVRYGISGDSQEDTVRIFGGTNVGLAARSHVANPPRATSRFITFAVIRLAMARKDRYDTAIAFTLLPEFEGLGDAASAEASEFQSCVEGNNALPPGETPADCGDAPTSDVDPEDAADAYWDNMDCNGSWCP